MKAPSLHDLDLNLFRVFDAVSREGNLTRAAGRLYVSQSAVSHALARLRDRLGDPLFVRRGQGVAPTALAQRIAGDVRRAVALLEGAVQGARPFDAALDVAEVRLAMADEIEPLVLPPLLARAARAAPAARVASVRLDREPLAADLALGRVDCAIDVARAVPPDVGHALLVRDEFVVVARRARARSRAGYLAAGHVTVSSRRSGRSVEDIAFARMGLERDVRVRCQQYETALRVALGGDLLLTMPRRLALTLGREAAVHLAPLPIRLPALELHAYWSRGREGDSLLAWLRALLQDAMREGAPRKRGTAGRARR